MLKVLRRLKGVQPKITLHAPIIRSECPPCHRKHMCQVLDLLHPSRAQHHIYQVNIHFEHERKKNGRWINIELFSLFISLYAYAFYVENLLFLSYSCSLSHKCTFHALSYFSCSFRVYVKYKMIQLTSFQKNFQGKCIWKANYCSFYREIVCMCDHVISDL